MCTKTNNHIYAELNCNVYEDFLEISKKILQIAFSIFDKPSLAGFCIKIASLPERQNVVLPVRQTCTGWKKIHPVSSSGEGFAELEEVILEFFFELLKIFNL